MVELVDKAKFAEGLKQFQEPAEPAAIDGKVPAQEAAVYDQPQPATELQSKFAQFVERMNIDNDQSTAMALEAAKTQNPALYRKAQELSGLEDLPPGVVYRNIDQFKDREKLRTAREVLATNPTLNEWFRHADNSLTVEVENLQAMNRLAWTVKAGGRALTQGGDQVSVAHTRWKEMFGEASPSDLRAADSMEATFTDDFGADSWVGRGFVGAMQQLPIMGSVIYEGAEGGIQGAAVGGAIGSVVPGLGTAAGMGGGALVGSTYGAGKESLILNGGLAFSEYKRIKDENGKLLSPETARGAALIAGAISAGLDTASMGVLLKATGFGELFAKYGAKQGIKQALKNATFREVAAKVGLRFAGAVGAEVVTEMVQEGVQIAMGEVAKISETHGAKAFNTPGRDLYGDFKPVTFEQAYERVAEAGQQAFFATAFLGAVPMGGRMAIDYAHARKQTGEQQQLKSLTDLAKDDALVKAEPAKAAELAAETLRGTDKEVVYLDTASVREFMQDEGEQAEMSALSKVPGFQKALQEAVQSGSDVAIPTADFYAYVAPTDAAAKIIDRLKFSPEGMSKTEAEAFVKAVEKIKEKGIPTGEPEGSVGASIYEQTRKAGATPDQARSYAALYSAFFESMASQTGRSAYDIFKGYNIQFEVDREATPKVSELNSFTQSGKILRFPGQPEKDPAGENAAKLAKFNDPVLVAARKEVYARSIDKNDAAERLAQLQEIVEQTKELTGDVSFAFQRQLELAEEEAQAEADKHAEAMDNYTRTLADVFKDDNSFGQSFGQAAAGLGKRDTSRIIKLMTSGTDRKTATQIMEHVSEMIATAGSAKAAYEQYDLPSKWMFLYRYALEAAHALQAPMEKPISPEIRKVIDFDQGWARGVKVEKEIREEISNMIYVAGGLEGIGLPARPGVTSASDIGMEADVILNNTQSPAVYANGNELLEQFMEKNWDRIQELRGVMRRSGVYATLQNLAPNGRLSLTAPLVMQSESMRVGKNQTVDAPRRRKAFGQGKDTTLRGSITFSPDKTTIRLFKNANLSTLLHETGHLFFQVMSDLVHGQQAYGGTLFQTEEVQPGDMVMLYDNAGMELLKAPARVSAVVAGPNGPQFTLEGGKGIYEAANAVIMSSSTPPVAEDVEAQPSTDEVPPLPVGEAPVPELSLGNASSLGVREPVAADILAILPDQFEPGEDGRGALEAKFDLLYGSNRPFRVFVGDKPASNPVEKASLLIAYFPKSKEAQRYYNKRAHVAQNQDPHLSKIIADLKKSLETESSPEALAALADTFKTQVTAPRAPASTAPLSKKVDPLGIGNEVTAALDINQTVKRVGTIIDAAAKLTQAISGRQAKRALTVLRFSMKRLRHEQDMITPEVWAEVEADLAKLEGGTGLKEDVKNVVSQYIEKYKQDQSAKAAKQKSKDKREGEQAAAQVEAVRAEDVKSAIVELANVIDRVEKIEQQKVARQQLIDDLAVLQEWVGEKGPHYSTAAHEKFAKGFEAYLFLGHAPSDGLRRIFDRFKTWLRLVYRKISNIGVVPTPEVRAVFDRMLTIDTEIQNEMAGPAFQPSFNSAEEMGVSQAEFDAYMSGVNKIAEVGRQAAESVAMAEAGKLRREAIQDKKKELRKEYTNDLMGQRVYRVIAYLQGKELGGIKSVKLDRKRVEQIVGRGKLNTIPNGAAMWAKEGGADPNLVATMFGYNSGAEMLAEIQSVEPLKVAVDTKVNNAIKAMAEEELVIPSEVAEMTAAKLRSEVYQEFLRVEIRTFAKLMGLDFTAAHESQFKQMAQDVIDGKSVRTIERRNFMREYTEADRKIGRLLDQAIKKKQWADVLDLRRKQLFNSYLIQNAYNAKEQTNRAVKYLKGFTKKKSNVIDQAYLTQIRNITIGLNLVKGQRDANATPFSRFLDEELANGSMIVIDPRVKKQSNKAYQHLQHGELMAVYDAVKNLDYMGRNIRSIFRDGKAFDLNKAVAEIGQAMDNHIIPIKGGDALNRRGWDTAKHYLRSYWAMLTKIEQLCDWIDGRAPQGPAHKYIFQPMADAQAREVEMTQQYAQKVLEIINQKPADYWADEVIIPEIGKRVKRSEMMAVALNMGNESNLKKLKKGMGWTDEQLKAVTDRMDKKDWQIAQQIWDTIDGLWPNVLEVAARTGIPRPDKVQPMTFTNEHGTFRGGYYPVVYDPSRSADALARGLTTRAEAQFGFQPQSVFPQKSFANDRDNEYARPILLDMTVLPEHISRVVHYVTHAEAAYSVQRILSHSDMKDRILANFGEAMFENIKGWVENITRGEVEPAGLSAANRFMRAMRRNLSVAALGFRATTVIAQAGGIFAGAEMIGMGNVGAGIKEMYGSASLEQIQANFDFVREKSAEMRHRTQFLERDLVQISATLKGQGKFKKLKDWAMQPIMAMDNVVSTAVWMGAYKAQLGRDIHDEKKAVAYADKVVRLTQGAAGAKDLAAVQRGSEFFRIFSMFYTYFSAMQNRLMDLSMSAKERFDPNAKMGKSPDAPNELLRYLYLVILPTVTFDLLMKGALQGSFTDDDEKNDVTIGTALWKVAAYSMAGLVGIRDLVSFVGKEGFDWKYSTPPALRAVDLLIERANRVAQGTFDESKDVKPSDVVRLGVDAIGLTTGLPIDAPTLILQNYLKAQEKGEDIGLTDFVARR